MSGSVVSKISCKATEENRQTDRQAKVNKGTASTMQLKTLSAIYAFANTFSFKFLDASRLATSEQGCK